MLTTQEKRERALKLIEGGMTAMAAVKKVGISYGGLYYKPKASKTAKMRTKRLAKEHLPLVPTAKLEAQPGDIKMASYELIDAIKKFIAVL